MRGACLDVSFVQSNKAIVFFVDIKVLYDPESDEVSEVFQAQGQVVYVLLSQGRFALRAHNQRTHQAAAIRSDVDAVLSLVVVDRNKLLNASPLPQKSQVLHKFIDLVVNADGLTIQEYQSVAPRMQLVARHQRCVLHSKIDRQL